MGRSCVHVPICPRRRPLWRRQCLAGPVPCGLPGVVKERKGAQTTDSWDRGREKTTDMVWRGIGLQPGCMGQSQYGAGPGQGKSEEVAMGNTDVCCPNRTSHYRPVALSLGL